MNTPQLMENLCHTLVNQEKHPVTQAALAHYELVTIHPFIDGNGRSARLLMNLILMQNGYPPAIIRTSDRLRYLNLLESAQTNGLIEPFLNFIYQSVLRSLDIYLKALDGDTVGVTFSKKPKNQCQPLDFEPKRDFYTALVALSLGTLFTIISLLQ